MNNNYFVANWKMRKPFNDAVQWCTHNNDALSALQTDAKSIVLCPNATALATLSECLKTTSIGIGAQNCSEHESGSFTGEIDAFSIKQAGAHYCIVGHSERRTLFGETDEMVAHKIEQLAAHGVAPIVCIGENEQERKDGKTNEVLQKQLSALFKSIQKTHKCLIAYEPIWAIGTGNTPSIAQLTETFVFLHELIAKHASNTKIVLLYGGSVDETNTRDFLSIAHVNGLLIGGASLDFQKFEKIVSLGR